MTFFCSLASQAECIPDNPNRACSNVCLGHMVSACENVARYRIEGSDGWSLQYACGGAHLDAMVHLGSKVTSL